MTKAWIVEENQIDQVSLLKNESLFNVANGYIGIRGNFEEGYPADKVSIRGNYINAFYEEATITYGEKAFGFPETLQKIVNVMDGQTVFVTIGEERVNLFEGELKDLKRFVNLKEGYYTRQIHWVSPKGKEVKIDITRLASFTTLELFAIHYHIEKINFDEEVIIESVIDGNVENYTNPNDPRVGASHAQLLNIVKVAEENQVLQVVGETKVSKLQVALTTTHRTNCEAGIEVDVAEKSIAARYTFDKGNAVIEFTKYNVYTDTRRHTDPVAEGICLIKQVSEQGFETIKEAQKVYLDTFWEVADIEILGDEALQQGLRFNIYQLLQGVGKDQVSNIGAKGLSGEGYEGHYFWDTEIYVMPFFTLCNPEIAKQLLRYRYHILDEARARAKELGHRKGAAYAWRTITGKECSAYFPAGTAQYHINGDIAYTYIQYYLATGDQAFIKDFGLEVICETARIWLEIGHFQNGLFRIDAVTGPDEYTAIVNNNYYTNQLAKYNLSTVGKWVKELEETDPEALKAICEKIGLTQEELDSFERASENMYLPYDEERGICAQDDSFLSKAVWDFENTPKENYPLLLYYHPLTIYRYQVLKQADVVLSHFLLEDDVDLVAIKKSYDYYEKITTHDSSLSCAIYSIVASKIGYEDKAYKYFIETARLDLDNTHNNTKDGVHIANMGGTWMAIVYGFAGLRIKKDHISLEPKLPAKWDGLSFTFLHKGAKIKVKMQKDKTILEVFTTQSIQIKVKDVMYLVEEDTVLEI